MFVGYTAVDPADVKNKKKMGVYSKMAAENMVFVNVAFCLSILNLSPKTDLL